MTLGDIEVKGLSAILSALIQSHNSVQQRDERSLLLISFIPIKRYSCRTYSANASKTSISQNDLLS
ncbi:hypothetical protein [Okeania sp. SIO2B3]|uniref:hypothetical protein n=1 Tax=Okeania sp. SIO2B3 TaxID=2607784 RepID=UPI0013BF9E94|nr:hypothetical protein [Okeania sp. SIO2B3]NET44001.1 hypothetical protein [Okeania sp. SIO2B3]